MPDDLLQSLPERLREFHDRILKERDEAWAHSDWQAHEPKSYDSDHALVPSIWISRNPWQPFSPAEIDTFRDLLIAVDAIVTSSANL